MSTQVAVLAPLGRDSYHTRQSAGARDRPLVRLAGFTALGLYGVLRWATLMKPAPTWRLLGLLALAVALAGAGPLLLQRERAVAVRGGRKESASVVGAPLAVVAFLAIFPLVGVPLGWTLHLRVAVTADGIGQGLSALPGILVPYSGINQWVQVVILLGAAILLLDAGMLLAFAPPALGDIRRAGAALPLIALVVVPATLVHPHLAYLQGLVLFALLAFFMWGERVPVDRRGSVVLACAVTGALGMALAPAIDQHSPWIDPTSFARSFTPAHVEHFDWTQRYGPLVWPRTGNDVLEVSASPKAWSGEYWKAENLDSFDGRGWTAAGLSATGQPPLGAATLARWTQSLTVTVRAMQTTQVIAAGTAQAPTHIATALPGSSAGTWISQTVLGPGDSYRVQVYAPHPSPARLARAGDSYPLEVRRTDLTLSLPQVRPVLGVGDQSVLFPAFASRRDAPQNQTDPVRVSGREAIANSPYGQAYALAQRMVSTSRTPYAYVQRVLGYLGSGLFSYDEYPPPTPYPLETFLSRNHLGYCQQFAGAMALLLRMGGVPARVATGFTTGTYDNATKHWMVSDINAHAWVEAWFPHYGWISFDPTPAAAPARGGRTPISSNGLLGASSGLSKLGGRQAGASGASGLAGVRTHSGDSAAPFLLGTLGLLVALLVLTLVAWHRSGPLDADGLLAELERALARSGRPISEGVTLAALEQRFRTSPEAASYLRTLRMSRFAGERAVPTLSQRRALRAQLRAGLGLGGALRALWALPPRPRRPRRPLPGDPV